MSAEIVNLNRVRKTRARGGREAQAAANRVALGRTAAQKDAALVDAQRRERALDGAKLDD